MCVCTCVLEMNSSVFSCVAIAGCGCGWVSMRARSGVEARVVRPVPSIRCIDVSHHSDKNHVLQLREITNATILSLSSLPVMPYLGVHTGCVLRQTCHVTRAWIPTQLPVIQSWYFAGVSCSPWNVKRIASRTTFFVVHAR